ncbi:hypothetical protein AOQ84DRAFT_411704, partial [Glonium stellatum]
FRAALGPCRRSVGRWPRERRIPPHNLPGQTSHPTPSRDSLTKPNPRFPSCGWDPLSKRVLPLAVFDIKGLGKRVLAANTHFDNRGLESRVRSVGVIIDTGKRVGQEWGGSQNEYLAVFLAAGLTNFWEQEA